MDWGKMKKSTADEGWFFAYYGFVYNSKTLLKYNNNWTSDEDTDDFVFVPDSYLTLIDMLYTFDL